MANLAAELINRAYQLHGEALPLNVRQHIKLLIMDTCATLLAGSQARGAREVAEAVIEWGGREQSTVLPGGTRVPAPNAALANAVAVHALDYDEGLNQGVLHAMAEMLPTVLALAELHPNCDGNKMVEAIGMGLESAARLAVTARQHGIHSGWVPATLFGGVGASIAGSYVFGLDQEQAQHAVGITYAQNGGNRQGLIDGAMTKRLQPGFASRAAVTAVDFALRGLTGPAGSLDGRFGLFPLVVGVEAPVDEILDGFGERFWVESFDVKAYPSCKATHQPISVGLDLHRSVNPADIERVVISLNHLGYEMVGAPFRIRTDPQVDAQFSAAYTVAYSLIHGGFGLKAVEPETVTTDEEVLRLARRIECMEMPAGQLTPPEIRVTLKNGQTVVGTGTSAETPAWDVSVQAIQAKLADCAGYVGLPGKQVDRLQQVCLELDRGLAVADLVAAVTRA